MFLRAKNTFMIETIVLLLSPSQVYVCTIAHCRLFVDIFFVYDHSLTSKVVIKQITNFPRNADTFASLVSIPLH